VDSCSQAKLTGEFIAIDEDTGKIVWQFQTSSGINAQPITYTHNGRQYVTVLSGLGGGTSAKRETAGRSSPAVGMDLCPDARVSVAD